MFGGKDKTEALLQGALFGQQRNSEANLLSKYGACFKQRDSTNLCSAQRDLYGSSLRSSLKMTRLWRLMREITTSGIRPPRNDDAETREITTAIKNRLVMTSLTLALALVFTFTPIFESFAATISCINGVDSEGKTCMKCGDSCDWALDTETGKLTIFGSGTMYNFPQVLDGTPSTNPKPLPWRAYSDNITAVDISGVSSIGQCAFDNFTNIQQVNMSDSVTEIGRYAFRKSPITELNLSQNLYNVERYAFEKNHLTSVTIPDSLTSLDDGIFNNINIMTEVYMSDTITNMGYNVFSEGNLTENLSIICLGELIKCQNLFKNYAYFNGHGVSTKDISGQVFPASEKRCNASGSYYYTGAECIRRPTDGSSLTCVKGYVEYKNKCWGELPFSRKHWTPSEAAKWLNDDNNDVILTFKK